MVYGGKLYNLTLEYINTIQFNHGDSVFLKGEINFRKHLNQDKYFSQINEFLHFKNQK